MWHSFTGIFLIMLTLGLLVNQELRVYLPGEQWCFCSSSGIFFITNRGRCCGPALTCPGLTHQNKDPSAPACFMVQMPPGWELQERSVVRLLQAWTSFMWQWVFLRCDGSVGLWPPLTKGWPFPRPSFCSSRASLGNICPSDIMYNAAVGVCSALILLSHTDFTAWSTQDTKWFAPTGWGICSCYVTEQLLHSAQLTLPQGRAGGNICTVSTGCHSYSEGCEPLPTHICPVLLFSISHFNNNCRWAVNHSKMKTHLKSLISVCKNMLNEKNLELDFISQATIYAAEMKSEWKLSDSWPSEEGQTMCWFLFGPENCVSCVRLGEGGATHHKWSNYLRMRSLFGSIIVWLYGPQRLSQAAQLAVLSHLCVRLLLQRHFSEFGWGHSVRQLGLSSEPQLSNHPCDRSILDVSADEHTGVKNGFVACH